MSKVFKMLGRAFSWGQLLSVSSFCEIHHLYSYLVCMLFDYNALRGAFFTRFIN